MFESLPLKKWMYITLDFYYWASDIAALQKLAVYQYSHIAIGHFLHMRLCVNLDGPNALVDFSMFCIFDSAENLNMEI